MIFNESKFPFELTKVSTNLLFFLGNHLNQNVTSEKLNWIMGTKYRKIRLHS
uniref:Uncharacterized protein n=1 Tax=Arundo donax TaxID=35708 RepID=A0A0A9EG15_ARUDO